MFWKFVVGAVKLRRRRLFLAFCAMAVAGALATALFTVYSDVDRKLSQQFQAFGPNVEITGAAGAVTVPLSAAAEVRKLGGAVTPILYAQLDRVIAAGIDTIPQYWHIEGRPGPCLAGTSLGMKPGQTLHLQNFTCTLDGTVSTGADEDNQVILPFATVARLSGIANAASVIKVRMPADKVDALARALPEADVHLIRAVAGTESTVIVKVRLALFVLLAIILVIVTISVSSNFGELVIERSKEIGILKAIGAAEIKIAGLFAAEALILATLATAAGYTLGIVLAGWIDQSVFETKFAIHVNPIVLLLSALVTFLVAGSATGIATGRIWRIQPAIILRGE